MTGATTGPQRGDSLDTTCYPPTGYPIELHQVVESELDVAYYDGVGDGYAVGKMHGWQAGYAAGLMEPDPPPIGSTAYRALEREALREALWPTAATLADAIAAFLRDVERRHHRGDYGVSHNAQTVLGNPDDSLTVRKGGTSGE